MIEDRKDFDLLWKVTEPLRYKCSKEILEAFIKEDRNLMFVDGEDVALCTFEYPGFYNVHWFYTSRGRAAINQGKAMIGHLFDDHGAQAARGMIRVDLKASRWAARQVGMKSYGLMTYPDGEVNELFIMTKQDYEGNKNG